MFLLVINLACAEAVTQPESFFCSMFGGCDVQDGKGKSVKRAFFPRLDFSETRTHYRIAVEVPGIAVKDIKVETENRNLYISGEKKQMVEDKDQKNYHQECRYGEFKRELLLPEDALIDGIQATCKEHVLSIMIPRKPSDRKTIPIQIT